MRPIIDIEHLTKVYGSGDVAVHALRDVQLTILEGEMTAIMGPSGSGKSTLMNILGCLDRPTGGTYRLAGEDVGGLDDDALASVRNRRIGFIFQNFNLLPLLTAVENVELPLIYRGWRPARRREAALAALRQVGLAERLRHRPAELSGGQQQRVAIARALAGEPDTILADEPTGNLDSQSGAEVMHLFDTLHRQGRTCVIVTHDEGVAAQCGRTVRLRDGAIAADSGGPGSGAA